MAKTIKQLKQTILEKLQRKLNFNSDYEIDEDYAMDLIDEAIAIINDWARPSTDELLSDIYNSKIINYCIESINLSGLEGQISSTANGTTKRFINSPEANLKSSIPQRLV